MILIVWIAIDYRRQKERLRELEASGVTRRSGRTRDGHLMSAPTQHRTHRAAGAGWWRCR